MILTVFRSRLRPDLDIPAVTEAGTRMYELATKMPGFLSYKDFAAEDGETVSIVEFESEETQRAWREHPEHVEVQRMAREQFMTEYTITIAAPIRTIRFPPK